MSTKAEMGGQKPPFWGYYIGNPILKNNRKLRENGLRYAKNTIDHSYKVVGGLSENTLILVTIATVTMETRHVTPKVRKLGKISGMRQRTDVFNAPN